MEYCYWFNIDLAGCRVAYTRLHGRRLSRATLAASVEKAMKALGPYVGEYVLTKGKEAGMMRVRFDLPFRTHGWTWLRIDFACAVVAEASGDEALAQVIYSTMRETIAEDLRLSVGEVNRDTHLEARRVEGVVGDGEVVVASE